MSVFQDIRQRILEDIEKLPPHTRLPSRPLLCEHYFASRKTIDGVITSLCADGHLYTVRNLGTYVADPTLDISITRENAQRHIAVIMPTQGINSSVLIQRGIRDRAATSALDITFCTTDHSDDKQHSIVRRLLNEDIDAIILQPPYLADSYYETAKLLTERGIPVVFLFRRFPGMHDYPLVCHNEVSASIERMRHLKECGYQRIACISDHGNATTNGEQLKSFFAAKGLFDLSHDLGHTLISDRLPHEQFTKGVLDMLLQPNRPDAFFCFNDTAAGAVYDALKCTELAVSTDVGVIGNDNSLICDSMHPPLTSMDIQAYRIGYTAMSLLEEYTDVKKPPQLYTLLEPQLYIRKSCLGPGVV